jgi:Fic family protein
MYIWQQPTWAKFTWDNEKLITLLSKERNLEGRLLGLMSGLGFSVQNTHSLDVMVEDVLRSSDLKTNRK